MTSINLSIALKIASVIISGLLANALNVVVIAEKTFQDSLTDFSLLLHKLETTSLAELRIYLNRADWQLSGQEYSSHFYQCQLPTKVVRAYIDILPLSSNHELHYFPVIYTCILDSTSNICFKNEYNFLALRRQTRSH